MGLIRLVVFLSLCFFSIFIVAANAQTQDSYEVRFINERVWNAPMRYELDALASRYWNDKGLPDRVDTEWYVSRITLGGFAWEGGMSAVTEVHFSIGVVRTAIRRGYGRFHGLLNLCRIAVHEEGHARGLEDDSTDPRDTDHIMGRNKPSACNRWTLRVIRRTNPNWTLFG